MDKVNITDAKIVENIQQENHYFRRGTNLLLDYKGLYFQSGFQLGMSATKIREAFEKVAIKDILDALTE